MFNKIRDRLIISNVIVFALVLGGAALAVRLVFVNNLRYQMGERLVALGQGILAEAELEQGQLVIEDEFLALPLLTPYQSFEWFDLEETSIEKMGEYFPEVPFDRQTVGEVISPAPAMQSVTLPISDDDTGAHIGYVRVSQRTDEISTTLFQLDMGLLAGTGVAMLLSGGGILWLNRQAMAPVEKSFQRLKQFTADASHELRNPLMAISSNVEVALKYPVGMRDEDRSVLQVVASATDQMTRLTEDLLLLARTDNLATRALAPIDVSALLIASAQLYEPQIVFKQIDLTVDVVANVRVRGEAASLSRAFGNLLQNAIRYTPEGGKVEVTLRCVK
ncbi:MAG: HAMP domain-containing sensor histidine kinase, partial [Cyanobacteria bacterium J06598_3]